MLLVVLDAARRDALEPYGAPPGSTPTLAHLATRGAALPDVYATGCWTVPSHSSIFTGLLPRAAGLARARSPEVAKPVLDAQRDRLLPEVMRRAGYSTGAVSANLWISKASGFGTGFDDFVQVDTERHVRSAASGTRERLRWLVEAARGRTDDGARGVGEVLRRWIAAPRRRPFFWFVNLMECHSPYLPPRRYSDVSSLGRLQAARDARRYYTLLGIWRTCAGVSPVPDATLARMRRLYGDSIRYMDHWLGELFERLDDARVLDDTLVIVTADHGENLGEQGLIAHTLSLDERLIHVPFVAAGPRAGGGTINSLAALPRLVAEAVGLEEHPWRDGPPDGFGVAQFDSPADPDDVAMVERFREAGFGDVLDTFTTPLTCAVAGGLKLLRRGDREELYDLEADPMETQPLSVEAGVGSGRDDRVAALRSALDHPAISSRPAAATPAIGGESAVSHEERRDLEQRMKLLGYM